MSRIKAVLSVLIAAVALSACAATPAETQSLPTPAAVNYKTTQVQRGTFELTQKSGGSFEYPVTNSLSYEYDGAILKEEIPVHRGSEVKKGDVLATFTFDVSNAELEKKELSYREVVSDAAQKRKEYLDRINSYSATPDTTAGKIAALQKEQAENELKLFEITSAQELEESQKELEEYRSLFSGKTLIAPCDGVVFSVASVLAGHEVAKGTALVTLYSPDTVYLKLSSPTKDMIQMASLGAAATVTSGKWSSSGKIVSTPAGIDEQTDNQDIYISIDNPQKIPQAGSPSAECVALRLDDMLLLDRHALHTDSAIKYVLILENGVTLKRNVLCGPENNEVVCILDGLSEGQQVILN